jgi:GNAT superfamily N-acetyltransferase
MNIRTLQAADKIQWTTLWRGYLDFYETKLSAEQFELTWSRLITPGSGIQGLCAVDEQGALIGLVHYLYHPSCWTPRPVCYLQDLFTQPGLRKKGVGRALIAAVNAAAKKDGASGVYWMTQHFNHNARRLYDQVAELTPFIRYRQNV